LLQHPWPRRRHRARFSASACRPLIANRILPKGRHDFARGIVRTRLVDAHDEGGKKVFSLRELPCRVCTALRVPRPQRGHWAKQEVGSAPARRALPEALPGDQLLWSRERDTPAPRVGAQIATTVAPQLRVRRSVTGTHGLIRGAKQHYETGYKVDDGQC
jgi:hypothetical protein